MRLFYTQALPMVWVGQADDLTWWVLPTSPIGRLKPYLGSVDGLVRAYAYAQFDSAGHTAQSHGYLEEMVAAYRKFSRPEALGNRHE
jgi:hypothetical protein